jgi:hypothetical protein
VSVKLLLDENLSPAAAVALAADDIDACHVLADHGAMINELLRIADDGAMAFEASPS